MNQAHRKQESENSTRHNGEVITSVGQAARSSIGNLIQDSNLRVQERERRLSESHELQESEEEIKEVESESSSELDGDCENAHVTC